MLSDPERDEGGRIAVVLSGGNITDETLKQIVSSART
jgi:hypothetical protein